jgi:hypothetical protein
LYEQNLAALLRNRFHRPNIDVDEKLLHQGLQRLFPTSSATEIDWQQVGALVAALRPFCVISGGPGTGKTTTVVKLLVLLLEQAKAQQKPLSIALLTPTGKAAVRLQESITVSRDKLDCAKEIIAAIPTETSTIHRWLGTIPGSPHFRFNIDNPRPIDVVIVDVETFKLSFGEISSVFCYDKILILQLFGIDSFFSVDINLLISDFKIVAGNGNTPFYIVLSFVNGSCYDFTHWNIVTRRYVMRIVYVFPSVIPYQRIIALILIISGNGVAVGIIEDDNVVVFHLFKSKKSVIRKPYPFEI